MPTYEYACKNCSNQLEVVQKFTDDPLTECPECGGTLRKVFGSIGISFKGSGFYKNDSRPSSSSKSSSTKSETSSSDTSSSSDSTSSTKESTTKSDSSSSSNSPSSSPSTTSTSKKD